MESKFLLPHRYKLIGWLLLVPSFIMGVLWMAGVRAVVNAPVFARSEERRVGKECLRLCRSRWSPYH